MKTRLAVGLILIALLSYGSMFNIPAVSGQAADDGSTRTVWSEAQATALANAWVAHKAPTFSEWQEAAVGSPVLYYDLDGLPVVYVFSVLNKNQDVGHIIVSYEVSDDPILVFGQGAAPHLRCPTCTDVQTLAAQGLVLAAKNPIYLGPVDYFYHVEPAAAQSQTTEENSYQLIPMGESVPMRITHQPASATPQDVLAGSAPDLSSSDVSGAATSKLIWGVPDYNQFLGSAYGYDYSCYSGCTPTAATNIVHFWDQAGYSGLAYTNWRDTTYYLRTYMETFCSGSSGSTYSDQPAPAMIKYAQTRGFSFSSMQYCWPGTNWLGCIGDAAWNVYTSQIDLGVFHLS